MNFFHIFGVKKYCIVTDADSISTIYAIFHLALKYLLHFLSTFTPNLLHFKNLLRYYAVFYDTFSLKKNVCKP